MHILPIKIYYEDTDAQGVVYYANYLKFFERARTEFLREIGYKQKELMEKEFIHMGHSSNNITRVCANCRLL